MCSQKQITLRTSVRGKIKKTKRSSGGTQNETTMTKEGIILCEKTAKFITENYLEGSGKLEEAIDKIIDIPKCLEFLNENRLFTKETEEFVKFIRQYDNETETDIDKQKCNKEELDLILGFLKFKCIIEITQTQKK
jgi:hypothetical protein